MMLRYGLIAASLLAGHAGAATPEEAFKAFAQCDQAFFSTANLAAFNSNHDLDIDAAPAPHFALPAASLNGRAEQSFAQPVMVNGVKFTGWFNEHFTLENAGTYYLWGFTLTGKLDDAVHALQPLVNKTNLQTRGDERFLRSEALLPASGDWLPMKGVPPVVAGTSHVERTLKIWQPKMRQAEVVCQLGGAVNGGLLQHERPDINPADYPYDASADEINATRIPAAIRQQIDAILQAHPELVPHFKSIHGSYTDTYGGATQHVDFQLERVGQLVLLHTQTGSDISWQSLSLNNLATLQSRLTGRAFPGKLDQIKTLKADLPGPLKPGSHFSISTQQGPAADGADAVTSSNTLDCRVNARVEAKDISPSFTGKALRWSCQGANPGEVFEAALIENLGVVLDTGRQANGLKGEIRYGELEIVR